MVEGFCLVTEPGSLIFPRWKWAHYLLKSWISEISKIHYTVYCYKKSYRHMMKCGWNWSFKLYINRHSSELNLTTSKIIVPIQKEMNLHFLHHRIEILVFIFRGVSIIDTFLIFNIHVHVLTQYCGIANKKFCFVSWKFWRV